MYLKYVCNRNGSRVNCQYQNNTVIAVLLKQTVNYTSMERKIHKNEQSVVSQLINYVYRL